MTMVEKNLSSETSEIINREAPQLVAVLKEMTDGLNKVRMKVDALTAKVKEGQFLRKDGISYLETKHMLLLNYCQSLVYYLLRKAKGLAIEGHPVVRSLIEIRLFLEKIRPIDKKLDYQIKKLSGLSVAKNVVVEDSKPAEKESNTKNTDLLKYRPNPELLVSTYTTNEGSVAYRPPKLVPTIMGEDKMSRKERNFKRMEENNVRRAGESEYVRDMVDDLEGKPEELREIIGGDSNEHRRFAAKMEKRARAEEEIFTRAPITKAEKQKMKHLKKSRNGLLGLTESLFDEVRSFPNEDKVTTDISNGLGNGSNNGGKKFKRRRGNRS